MPEVKVNAVPRGMGRIIPNPNGTFTYRWWVKGQGQHEETFSTMSLAEDKRSEVWRAKRAGEETFPSKSGGAVRFADYCGEWIDTHRNAKTRAVLRVHAEAH